MSSEDKQRYERETQDYKKGQFQPRKTQKIMLVQDANSNAAFDVPDEVFKYIEEKLNSQIDGPNDQKDSNSELDELIAQEDAIHQAKIDREKLEREGSKSGNQLLKQAADQIDEAQRRKDYLPQYMEDPMGIADMNAMHMAHQLQGLDPSLLGQNQGYMPNG